MTISEITHTPPMTDDEVRDLIVDLVEQAGGDAPWASVRSKLPRSRWRAGELPVALVLDDRVFASKYNGRTFVALPLAGSVAA